MTMQLLLRKVKCSLKFKNDLQHAAGRNILIHTERGDEYLRDGVLEEAVVHEAVHTSMDAEHLGRAGWLAAMKSDAVAVSRYASDNPTVKAFVGLQGG